MQSSHETVDGPSLNLMTVVAMLYTTNNGTDPRYEYCESISRHYLEGRLHGTYRHNPFKCAGLSSRGPQEAFELVVAPEMVQQKTQELFQGVFQSMRQR